MDVKERILQRRLKNGRVKGTYQYRVNNINNMLNWTLEQKEEHALKRIIEIKEQADKVKGDIIYSFSGGKDSCVLEHLIKRLYPNTKGLFADTTNEYIELIKFVKTKKNIIWVKPKIPFKETVSKYGFPLISKQVARSIEDLRNPTERNKATRNLYLTGIKRDGTKSKTFRLAKRWKPLIDAPFDTTKKCCDILKKEPLERWEKENPNYFILDGTTVTESSHRKMSWLKTGCNFTKKGKLYSKPISIFTEEDIWDYIKKYNVKYCELYDDRVIDGVLVKGEDRLGCKGCSMGIQFEKGLNRFERYALINPRAHKKLMELKNNGVMMWEALEFIGVKHGYKSVEVKK